MALGTLGTALAAPLIGAGVSWLGNKFFGSGNSGSDPVKNFAPSGFSGGGLNGWYDGSAFRVGADPTRKGLVQNLSDTFSNLAGEYAGLRPRVAPGISDLRKSRLAEVENARTSAIGNLRENLQRRRVMGSSFGADALARTEAEFGKEKERVAAESFLQEMELTNQLLEREHAAKRGQFQTGLDELNLEADLASKLSAAATGAMGQNAQMLALLNSKENAGAGKFWGDIGGAIAKGFAGGGSFFKGGGTPFGLASSSAIY